LFEEIAKIGEASVRRIYGDFSGSQNGSWTNVLAKFAIIPQQNFSYTTGKNACDIALVIDAMDLLHSGRFDGFCIVSSDSDFTRLAARIREQGIDVFGFGKEKTPESFRQACLRFFPTENFLPPTVVKDVKVVQSPSGSQSAGTATSLIVKAFAQVASKDGWVPLDELGQQLAKLNPGFDPRPYGAENLRTLVRKTKAFEMNVAKKGILRIRFKVPAAVKKKAA